MKYYYVILGSEWDLYKTSYSDLDYEKNENGIYIAGLSSLYGSKIARILESGMRRLNHIPCGFLLLTPLIIKLKRLKIKRPICFIYFSQWVRYDLSLKYIKYLKTRYPESRNVWFLQDIVESQPKIKLDIHQIIKNFDITLSFDFSDCKRYNLVYYPLVFSSIKINSDELPSTDIYFLGKAKNRLSEILNSYDILKSKGLSIDFNLVNVPHEQQIFKEGIHYIDGMSYIENLRHLNASRCVLEIMQKGGSGYTQRVSEILYFNKKLISNNQTLKDAPFFDRDNMYVIDDSYNIDESFIDMIRATDCADYNYKGILSPIKLLKFIDNKLI